VRSQLLRGLRPALIKCRATSREAKDGEVDACGAFFDIVRASTGHDAIELIEIMLLAAKHSLEIGRQRPVGAPLKLRRDAFVKAIFLLARAHRPVELIANFIDLADACQDVLPEADRERKDELAVRVIRVLRHNPTKPNRKALIAEGDAFVAGLCIGRQFRISRPKAHF
jgi:hypothetical protein